MAIVVNFNGTSLLEPGSYSDLKVLPGGLSEPALGVVALIGESEEGIAFASESGISAVSYGPDELAAIQDKYGSGELVDAAKIAISPSNDQQIKGGAQELVMIKTNASTKAQATIPQSASAYGTVKAKKAGAPGNNISVEVAIVTSKAVITVADLIKGVSEISDPLGGNAVLNIQCTDGVSSAAALTITATRFQTTVTGGTAASLDLPLSQFNSVKQLADFISAQPGYTASAASNAAGTKPVSVLDRVTAQDILTAYAVKQDAFEVRDFFAQSGLVDFTPAIFAGLPTVKAKAFLTGGARGATTAASVVAAFDALLKRRVNFVVPLFSRDATADISDNLTDASSTYTIDAVHAGLRAHVNQASTIKGRKERQGFAGYKGSYATTEEKSAALNAARVQLCFQDVDALGADGNVRSMQPHMAAVFSAAMKASAPIGLSNLRKSPNVLGFSHADFDPETQSEKAIKANLCFVKKAADGGFVWGIDNSTYASDKDAWIYNRPSVIFAGDFASFVIRLNTEVFIGQRNSDVSEETVKNQLVSVLDSLRNSGVIVADTKTAGRGYKDLKVKLDGSIIRIDVTMSLVENYEFILSDLKVQRAG